MPHVGAVSVKLKSQCTLGRAALVVFSTDSVSERFFISFSAAAVSQTAVHFFLEKRISKEYLQQSQCPVPSSQKKTINSCSRTALKLLWDWFWEPLGNCSETTSGIRGERDFYRIRSETALERCQWNTNAGGGDSFQDSWEIRKDYTLAVVAGTSFDWVSGAGRADWSGSITWPGRRKWTDWTARHLAVAVLHRSSADRSIASATATVVYLFIIYFFLCCQIHGVEKKVKRWLIES